MVDAAKQQNNFLPKPENQPEIQMKSSDEITKLMEEMKLKDEQLKKLEENNKKLTQENREIKNDLANNECVICVEFFDSTTQYDKTKAQRGCILTCGHRQFHQRCAEAYFKSSRQNGCPTCRAETQ